MPVSFANSLVFMWSPAPSNLRPNFNRFIIFSNARFSARCDQLFPPVYESPREIFF